MLVSSVGTMGFLPAVGWRRTGRKEPGGHTALLAQEHQPVLAVSYFVTHKRNVRVGGLLELLQRIRVA
jgi:hypothetical protein